MRSTLSITFIICLLTLATMPTLAQRKSSPHATTEGGTRTAPDAQTGDVLLPSRSPLISFRILFMTGSADDPAGKEGLANLTAALLAQGGSRQMTYEQIVAAFYPLATSFGAQVDKEMTVFVGTTHQDNLQTYYGIINQMLLDPGFREDDFTRVKTDAINSLKVGLRQSNDEELGKEYLYNVIYAGHPYGHYNVGTVSALEAITLADVRDFYQKHYTRANLVLGLAGNYPATLPAKVKADFAKLPAGTTMPNTFAAPKLDAGTHVDIIQRDTRSTAFSLGFPINVTRADKDFAALALVASYLGQHRSSNSYLYQRLREARGLNYGDYAYIEYFPRGMYQFEPDANLARQQQIFQIWLRPVEPANGLFALRGALYEFDKLVRDGMSPETFEATREFLSKYSNILTQTQDAQLGYALDSRYYKIGNFNDYLRAQLAKLTLADVNRAIRDHLTTKGMRIVVVTKDAQGFRDALLSGQPSPITYVSPKPQSILDEDKLIEAFKLDVQLANVRIVPVDQVFQ